MIDRFFQLKERNSSLRQEIIGGLTTFLTMSCIIFLHPNMLAETGMDKSALITITCLASFIGTLIVGLYMFRNIQKINFIDLEDGIPAFFTIIIMPFTSSISLGLSYGFLSFIILKIINGKFKQVSAILWVIGILSLANLIISP